LVYWDADALKDLLVGQADGTVKIYLNVNTEEDPRFDAGTLLQVGPVGSKNAIDVGSRPTPTVVDWNNDGKRDLVVGAWDGWIHLYLNEGTDTAPDYLTEQFVQEEGANLFVPSNRSSPEILDLDDDGKKDVLVGNTEGQILFYSNVATDEAPGFSGYVQVESDGAPINLPGTPRSRPYVCDWTGDGRLDVLVGAGDGLIRLYQGLGLSSVAALETIPDAPAAHLLAAYPNPFNPQTTIPFVLTRSGHVRLSVYDVTGRSLAVLADAAFSEGPHRISWTGTDGNGNVLPSGVYFVRMETTGTAEVEKLLLLR